MYNLFYWLSFFTTSQHGGFQTCFVCDPKIITIILILVFDQLYPPNDVREGTMEWSGCVCVWGGVNIFNPAVDWRPLLHTLTDRDLSSSEWPLGVPTHVTWLWPPFDLWPRYRGQREIRRVHILRIAKIRVLLVIICFVNIASKFCSCTEQKGLKPIVSPTRRPTAIQFAGQFMQLCIIMIALSRGSW